MWAGGGTEKGKIGLRYEILTGIAGIGSGGQRGN